MAVGTSSLHEIHIVCAYVPLFQRCVLLYIAGFVLELGFRHRVVSVQAATTVQVYRYIHNTIDAMRLCRCICVVPAVDWASPFKSSRRVYHANSVLCGVGGTQVQCTAGHECPEGSASPIPCKPVNTNNQTGAAVQELHGCASDPPFDKNVLGLQRRVHTQNLQARKVVQSAQPAPTANLPPKYLQQVNSALPGIFAHQALHLRMKILAHRVGMLQATLTRLS